MFTARYGLSHYIKQILPVIWRLIDVKSIQRSWLSENKNDLDRSKLNSEDSKCNFVEFSKRIVGTVLSVFRNIRCQSYGGLCFVLRRLSYSSESIDRLAVSLSLSLSLSLSHTHTHTHTHTFILQSMLRQTHGLFLSQFSTQCDLLLSLSIYNII